MSEPIKNTLFRFATMRTPELIPEKEKKDYHIHHPNPTGTGFFATALASPAATQAAQLAALTTLATGFTPLTSTAAVKTYVGDDFFNFSVWLAKNHTAVFNGTATPYSGTMPTVLNSTKQLAIWDNFFYQLIKDISPQLRQFYIELLVANGYLDAEAETYQNQLAVARVVIPSSFYGTGATNMLAPFAPEAVTDEDPVFYGGEHKAMLAAVIANEKIDNYNGLLQELKQAEKKYITENGAAYKTAGKDYEQTVNEILAPDLGGAPIEGETEIPTFDFAPAPEMDNDFLEARLTAASLALAEDMGLPGNTSFAEAFEKINTVIVTETKRTEILNEYNSRSVVLNNMTFPVKQQADIINPLYSYYLESLFLLNSSSIWIYCSVYMGVPDEHVVSAEYHAVIDGTTYSGTAFTENAANNYLFLTFYKPAGLAIPTGVTEFRVHGSITTASSVKLTFDIQHNLQQGAYGIMLVDEGEEEGGGQTINPPSGYGIKRIGLADYRRVEQSVCCYLPGEVSHIENVMAREYKERSSRRLTRSEDTTVSETSMEKETQKDSSSTERYELQKEIDTVVTKDTSVEANANVSYTPNKMLAINAGASFAYNTSREDSNHTAINYSKEITEKALERVVLKIREERTIKIIEEFEEQNKHGLDNRLGDRHISGVYRWVDKVYKNQVFNYGKRLMYEFVIPQPASFHNQAVKLLSQQQAASVLVKPVDPRTAAAYRIDTPEKLNSVTFPYWMGVYNAEVKAAPEPLLNISEAFSLSSTDATGDYMTAAKSFKMEIAEGYEATNVAAGVSYVLHGGNTSQLANIRIANGANIYLHAGLTTHQVDIPLYTAPVRKSLAIAAESRNLGGLIINVTANCRRTAEAYANWQLEAFTAIITAYNEELDAYNKAIATYKQPDSVKQLNPGFYRQIENTVLRKNCITYLVSDANMGKKFYQGNTTGTTLPQVNAQMDQYAAMVKFIEQAFEWEIMSYKFYPFYWGDRSDWQQNYQVECDDPIFRSFLQSGMARAIVSIRPGFEEAVMYFMATGKIWNGGQVPAIGDDLYLSIVEELKNPEYYIDETWETRVPTTLTVIQSGNIGLEAEGLPCACGDENDIAQNENKLGVVVGDGRTDDDGEIGPDA